MVAQQLRRRDIADERVLAAMERVPRELFVPAKPPRPRLRRRRAAAASWTSRSPQPYIVAKIAETLALRGDELVLDVGSGSGYGAAVLAELASARSSRRAVPGSRSRRAQEPRRGRGTTAWR